MEQLQLFPSDSWGSETLSHRAKMMQVYELISFSFDFPIRRVEIEIGNAQITMRINWNSIGKGG